MPLATTTGRQTRPRRLMLYGVHGIGKSTFAAESPNAVFLPTEDGIADIDCESYPLSSCFDQFMHYLQELHDEEHDRSTLVIDSLDWLFAFHEAFNSLNDINRGVLKAFINDDGDIACKRLDIDRNWPRGFKRSLREGHDLLY